MTYPVPVEPHVKTPPMPGNESAGPAATDLVAEFRRTTQQLHALYQRLSRMWDSYRAFGTGVTASNACTISLDPLTLGWEAEVELLAVTVGGASAAATAVVYRNGANSVNLIDQASAFVGNTPSRVVHYYNPPLRLYGGESIVVVVAAAAGGTNDVVVHIDGRKREL